MRAGAAGANRVLTGEQSSDLLSGLDVRLRQQVGVGPQDRFRAVAEPGGDDWSGTPFVRASVAGLWRRTCRVPIASPAALRCRPNASVRRCGLIGPPSALPNTRSWSTYQRPGPLSRAVREFAVERVQVAARNGL